MESLDLQDGDVILSLISNEIKFARTQRSALLTTVHG